MWDYVEHHNDEVKTFRHQWAFNEPRLISAEILAYFYVFAFLSVIGFVRTNPVLGPLRITLNKMLLDVIRFLFIFALIMFAFSIGLCELYWYYGSAVGSAHICSLRNETNLNCEPAGEFYHLWASLSVLFWGIFGYLDPYVIDLAGLHYHLEVMGLVMLGIYHVAVVVLLINMLIAMMTKSYEKTSANEKEEWMFYRTVIWIRFIRNDFTCPPPMNLIPIPYYLFKMIKKLCFSRRMKPRLRDTKLSLFKNGESFLNSASENTLTACTVLLVHRYKLHHFRRSRSTLNIGSK